MLNKRGLCALHLKIIADAAGVGIGAAREALNIADTIGLPSSASSGASTTCAVAHPSGWQGFVNEHFERETVVKKAAWR